VTTSVYVWENSPSDIGHASLQVSDTYMSFWPHGAAYPKKDIKIGQTHDPHFPSQYRGDRRNEGRDYDAKIILNKLDEDAMLKHWDGFRKSPQRYNMLKYNCSTLVAVILEIGSGLTYKHSPRIPINQYVNSPAMKMFLKVRFLSNYIELWTPGDIKRYALQIKSHSG